MENCMRYSLDQIEGKAAKIVHLVRIREEALLELTGLLSGESEIRGHRPDRLIIDEFVDQPIPGPNDHLVFDVKTKKEKRSGGGGAQRDGARRLQKLRQGRRGRGRARTPQQRMPTDGRAGGRTDHRAAEGDPARRDRRRLPIALLQREDHPARRVGRHEPLRVLQVLQLLRRLPAGTGNKQAVRLRRMRSPLRSGHDRHGQVSGV